jgi:hypothetical protein
VFDFAVGTGLRGMTAAEQFAYLRTPAGLIYVAALVAFAALPGAGQSRPNNAQS